MQLPIFSTLTEAEKSQRAPLYSRIIKWVWRLALAGVGVVALLFFTLSFQDLPSFQELENPENNLASQIFAERGGVLGLFYVENRVPVSYEELNPHLVSALVATEDERYYKHSGIDGRALIRVAFKTVLFGDRSAGGGSTISQQLAKLLYSDRDFKGLNKIEKIFALFTRKFKEWITAVKLEKSYTKEEILAMYLNQFDFIYGAHGIHAAAQTYFGKNQDELDVEEAALLVGMLKNPSLYNPIRRPEIAKKRREVVFDQMRKADFLSKVEYDSLRNSDLKIRYSRSTHNDGLAPYFRTVLGQEVKKILSKKECRKQDGSKYNIYLDGLKIYTTIDTSIQKHMEDAISVHMPQLQKKFWKRWEKRDPWDYRWTGTTEAELEMRKDNLKYHIRHSKRYTNLFESIMGPVLADVEKETDEELKDWELEDLAEEHEKGSIIKKLLVSSKEGARQRATKYRKILMSDQWTALYEKWKVFEEGFYKSFNTPTPMRVFAYNEHFEKDTVMSPFDSIKYHRMFLQLGSVAIDPVTGYVRGWVGGINHKYFQYDHVTSQRQVGSTFKPFIYSTAIAMQAMSPCAEVVDQPITIHKGEGNFRIAKDWTPKNASGKYTFQRYTLKEGLKRSKNTVSVYLIKLLGDTEPVRKLVRNLGLNPDELRSDGEYRIPKQPSICLGSADLTVMEMTSAYTVFANDGVHSNPVYITRIEDRNGKKIYEQIPEGNKVLKSNYNYVMVDMLRHVTAGARGFHQLKSDVGGKTGTTNRYTDGWFIGLTPNIVIGTWVGGEDRWVRFFSLENGQGAVMARPYFLEVMKRIEADSTTGYDPKPRFKKPSGDLGIIVDCDEYRRLNGLPKNILDGNEEFGDNIFADEMEGESFEEEF